MCPWARNGIPGASDDGNKFDLTKWDAAYLDRLKDFIKQAGERGVVVEFVRFLLHAEVLNYLAICSKLRVLFTSYGKL